jgi:hypothetical protein
MTMTVSDLLDSFTDLQILDNLGALLPQYAGYREGYRHSIESIRKLVAEPSDMRIFADGRIDPLGFKFFTLYGCDGTPAPDECRELGIEEQQYVLSWKPWKEWLGYSPDSSFLGSYGRLDALCIILSDMTSQGFTEEEIQEGWKEFQERCDQFREGITPLYLAEDAFDQLRRFAEGDDIDLTGPEIDDDPEE